MGKQEACMQLSGHRKLEKSPGPCTSWNQCHCTTFRHSRGTGRLEISKMLATGK